MIVKRAIGPCGGGFLVAMRRPHKAAEVAWVDMPLLSGFVGVWLHRVTPPFRRRNEGLHSPE